jgi:hypothetical protein
VAYYLGHAFADVVQSSPYRVTAADLSAVQQGVATAIVSVNDLRDINKDRRVTSADLSIVQSSVSTTVLLRDIIIPATGAPEEGSSGSQGSMILPPLMPPNPNPDPSINNAQGLYGVIAKAQPLKAEGEPVIGFDTAGGNAASIQFNGLGQIDWSEEKVDKARIAANIAYFSAEYDWDWLELEMTPFFKL